MTQCRDCGAPTDGSPYCDGCWSDHPTHARRGKPASMKIIIARYPGVCGVCGKTVREGESVYWGHGQGIAHERCMDR